jgi:hypothetical protein
MVLPDSTGLATEKERRFYRRIMSCFMRKLYYRLVTTGAKVKLPWFGTLQVVKYSIEAMQQRREAQGKRRLVFVDYNALRILRARGIEPKKLPVHSFKNTNGFWWWLNWNKSSSYFERRAIYNIRFSTSNVQPNTVNKRMPEVHVAPFFLDKGYVTYREIDIKKPYDD